MRDVMANTVAWTVQQFRPYFSAFVYETKEVSTGWEAAVSRDLRDFFKKSSASKDPSLAIQAYIDSVARKQPSLDPYMQRAMASTPAALTRKVNFDAAPAPAPAPAATRKVNFDAAPATPATPALTPQSATPQKSRYTSSASDFEIAKKRAEAYWKKHPRGKNRDMASLSKRIAKDPKRFNPSRADWPGIDTPN